MIVTLRVRHFGGFVILKSSYIFIKEVFKFLVVVVPEIPVELVLTTATVAPIEVIVAGGVSATELAAAAYNAANPGTTVQTSAVATENLAKFETNAPLSPAVEDFNRWLQEYIIDNIDPAAEFMEIVRFKDKDCLSDDECKCTTEADCGIKKWYLDRDGWYAKKKLDFKFCSPEVSPSTVWNMTSNKGFDCNDDIFDILNLFCFEDEKPCKSADGKKANPLNTIQVLGTIGNGISGGLYGNGRGRFHDGVDLEAPVNTPIYSIYSGTVDFSITSHTEGENWDERGTWTGDRNGAGNRIYISSTVDSDNYQFGYWHLSEVETNPNTGEPYKAGDIIAQGDLIGYVGTTGNANSDDSAGPHLHLRGRKNGQVYDPIQSFNTTIDTITGEGAPCD